MNATEIKKAWNTFKKEIAKEVDFNLTGCCYMTARQINNGTATITLCFNMTYDREIDYHRKAIKRVNSYDTWTPEEKKKNEEHNTERIAYYEALKAKYGTRADEAAAKYEAIANSKAFEKLSECIGIDSYHVELNKDNCYQLRISY